jgi:hypothetical protein
MNQRKTGNAEALAKTQKSNAAQTQIQGKTTAARRVSIDRLSNQQDGFDSIVVLQLSRILARQFSHAGRTA